MNDAMMVQDLEKLAALNDTLPTEGDAGRFRAGDTAPSPPPPIQPGKRKARKAAPPVTDAEQCALRRRRFPMVRIDDLAHAELPPQRWFWDRYIPADELTLLGAHGGAGKTAFALTAAACIAVGMPLFGVDTTPARVLFFSAEDPPDVMRRRLQSIARALGADPAALAGRLMLLDATQADPTLFAEALEGDPGARRLVGRLTAAGADLADDCAEFGAELLIVDNASDTYGANENERQRVREFVRALVRTVRAQRGAVLLLAHVDKGTSRNPGTSSESYSGSTAWHNSARSRLYLSADKDGSGLTLEHQKSNRGRRRDPLRLVWTVDGVPVLDAPAAGIVGLIAERNDTKALLRLIHEFHSRGEWVSTATTSRTHAGKLLRGQPGFPPRMPDAELFDLLRQAERRGLLARVQYAGPNRHPRERWQVTAAGAEAADIRDFAPTAPTAPTSVVDAVSANGAEAAPTAPTSAPGGVGGNARAQVGAEVAAE